MPLAKAVPLSKNCRLFFGGQAVSLVGTWMTQTAVLWLVYQLTGSSVYLGLIAFVEQVPNFFLVPITGGIIEYGDRRKILLATQILSLLHALALALLVWSNTANIGFLIVLSLIRGAISAFDITTRQVFIADIVANKPELRSAISINALIISVARFIGPGMAGLLIAYSGLAVCFAIDTLSYLVVIGTLWRLRLAYLPLPPVETPWQRFRAGWSYVAENSILRSILFLLAAMGFLGGSYPTLTPIFAQKTFLGGSDTLGYLLAAAGIGSLVGSLYLSWRQSKRRLDRLLLISTVGLGLGLIGFAQSRIFGLSLLMMFIIGLCLVLQAAICNILLQSLTIDRHRGVVMSLFTVAYIGMTPFGNLLIGRVAAVIGASSTLTINGVLCLLGFSIVRKIAVELAEADLDHEN
jgi:MFS family permease